MAGVLIDGNVLLDLVTEDPDWLAWSAATVERVAGNSRIVMNAVI